MGLKILVDEVPHLKIIVTGSSSFELSNKIGEPLTGRKRYLVLFPISQMELNNTMNKFEQNKQLNNYLIYGSYPEVLTTNSKSNKIIILDELVNSYMLKDILVLENIKASNKLLQILKLLAFQIGCEVSLNEISSKVGLDVKTVDKYLNLLEKCFVIFRISGFSRNLRNEITSKCKYYFFDNGIRNSIINNFNNLDSRNDIGMLFENFIILERQKFNHYTNKICGSYFWRTHTQQEIDLIEDMNGKLNAFEITWSQNKTKKIPSLWKEYYPDSNYCVINNNNYLTYCI